MEKTTLQAEVRTDRGKGPARRLRMQGKVPGIFYGPGLQPTPLTLPPKELAHALRGAHGRNALFELKFGDQAELAMVKDLATDPVTREIVHVDLYRVFEDRELELMVPLKTKGRAIGVVQGGVLNVTRRAVPVRTLPGKTPTELVIDVSPLDMHDSIAVRDLTLPEGCVCTLKPELTLAIVIEDRRAAMLAAEEAAAAAAAGAAAEAGAAAAGTAAPAADGAAGDGDGPAGD